MFNSSLFFFVFAISYFQGCPSFRKRRPSLAPLLEATGANAVTAHSGIHKEYKNTNGRTSNTNAKFRSPTVVAAAAVPPPHPKPSQSPTFQTNMVLGTDQGVEYESDESLVV